MRVNTNNHFPIFPHALIICVPQGQNTLPPETTVLKHTNDCCIWIFISVYRNMYSFLKFFKIATVSS